MALGLVAVLSVFALVGAGVWAFFRWGRSAGDAKAERAEEERDEAVEQIERHRAPVASDNAFESGARAGLSNDSGPG